MKEFRISRGGYVSQGCVIASQTDSGYFYFNLGGGGFNRPKRIWINRNAIQLRDNKYVIADKLNHRVTNKGNIVLFPGSRDIVTVFGECGYRGTARIITTASVIAEAEYWHSERASLGTSHHLLLDIKEGDRVTVKRTGRLYGAPSVVVFEYHDGDLVEVSDDPELEALL